MISDSLIADNRLHITSLDSLIADNRLHITSLQDF